MNPISMGIQATLVVAIGRASLAGYVGGEKPNEKASHLPPGTAGGCISSE